MATIFKATRAVHVWLPGVFLDDFVKDVDKHFANYIISAGPYCVELNVPIDLKTIYMTTTLGPENLTKLMVSIPGVKEGNTSVQVLSRHLEKLERTPPK